MWYRVRRFWSSLNKMVVVCTVLLLAVGWALVLSATLPPAQGGIFPLPTAVVRQSTWIGFGFIVLMAGASVDYHLLVRLSLWIYGIGLLLLVLVLGVGVESFGARRWFALGTVFMQPGEFIKLGVLLMVVRLAAAAPQWVNPLKRAGWPRWLGVSLFIVSVPMVLIASQPNLGTAMLLLLLTVAVWIVARAPVGFMASASAAGVVAAPFVWAFLKDYQRARILNFLNPYRDPLGGGYAVIQSITAIGSGGLIGRGWMNGTQNRLGYIPKDHTDFIVSVLGEEAGWVGCCIVLMVYLFLFLEGLRIAQRARDPTGMYLAVGIVALLASQTLINLGMNVGLMPVSGLPLPLLSYGGSSLLISTGLVGILLSIGRQDRR